MKILNFGPFASTKKGVVKKQVPPSASIADLFCDFLIPSIAPVPEN